MFRCRPIRRKQHTPGCSLQRLTGESHCLQLHGPARATRNP
jgi:hypothetical protein